MVGEAATLFVPCFVDHLYPGVAGAASRIAEHAGIEVSTPVHQTCCGQPAFNAGAWAEAAAAARHFASAFSGQGPIVCPGGSCVHMIRRHYPRLGPEAADVAPRVHDLFSYLEARGMRLPASSFRARAVLHEPCHHSRGARAMEAARRAAAGVSGLQIEEWKLASECCGFGGLFSVRHPALSTAMGARKLGGLVESGIGWIVTPDASCMMHLSGMIEAAGLPLAVVHLVELVAGTASPDRRPSPARAGFRPGPPRQEAPGTPLERRIADRLMDRDLGGRLLRAADHALARRAGTAATIQGWEGLRDRAASAKRAAIAGLEEGIEGFRRTAGGAGIVVHDAFDGEEARRTVLGILREAGAGRIVKSKSMLSEETGLRAALEEAGHEVLETDLGEFIVQLGGEPPSHVTAPAMHLGVREIAARFLDHGVIDGIPRSLAGDPAALDDASRMEAARALAAAARARMRDGFMRADAGLTGANFYAADTGTIVLVENESNIRLVTSIPRIHVAVVGIEKLVLETSHLAPLLAVLPVSTTGQRQSAAVSLLAGPRIGASMHVVLVDGGRRAMAADPVLREALACVRCGACMNACPIFRLVGGHAYGGTYPGPLGLMVSGALDPAGADPDLPFLSTLCGACEDVCPVRIPITDVILELRRRRSSVGPRGVTGLGLGAFGFLSSHPVLWSAAWRLAPLALRLAGGSGPVRAWRSGRTVPEIRSAPLAPGGASGGRRR